ncbi:mitochondrial 54S ribosomal mL50 protein [Aspergillus saccharolyticus JOP 1030-1]|uniref:Large ribosomal subunit protein mL50 n=1 Tax=Aspergillus saccharolyticus JOP 1030-1 TaxID=1450539 RepID=A0A318Z7Y0_9EURO|nr:hypothetical protein BP01DRAFT_393510 [Aspergillus saccharolyticus JOP 1030-1]PYH43415.1 hypothetical protein BP01DRAFT_393510 [Aspergillus saccharolyticus JOP 1030-1]
MRPSVRLLNLEVPSIHGARSLYVCSVCRHEARPRPIVARQFLRNASSANSLTEKVRRKIWGTDNPPGLKDPYGGEGVIERKFKNKHAQTVVEEETPEASQALDTAASEDAAPAADDYEPATTWEGLDRVGHLGRWFDIAPAATEVYESFQVKKKITKQGLLSLAAHQTVVELCLMHKLGKPLTSICEVVEHDQSVFKLIWKTKIVPASNGQWTAALEYPDKEAEEALVYIFEQVGGQNVAPEIEEVTQDVDVEDARSDTTDIVDMDGSKQPFFGYQRTRDNGFLSLSLDDPATKFAFLKRFSQLTGHFFPDPAVHSITTVQQVVDYVQNLAKPKPKKLAEYLANNPRYQSMPNVKVFAKRQKRSDRDEELGRKKLIEAELRARGLIE